MGWMLFNEHNSISSIFKGHRKMLLLVLVHLLIIDALAPPIDTLRSLSLGREGFTKIQERESKRVWSRADRKQNHLGTASSIFFN